MTTRDEVDAEIAYLELELGLLNDNIQGMSKFEDIKEAKIVMDRMELMITGFRNLRESLK
jgi:hypothetical protein